jgi:hypothetical protein
MSNSRIFQVHGIHQMMQGDVGVSPAKPGEERSEKTHEGVQGIAAECTEKQVEPHYIGP